MTNATRQTFKGTLWPCGRTGGTDPKAASWFILLKKTKTPVDSTSVRFLPGNDLLSQDSAIQVSSALEVLTTVFGMGTGGTPPELSPDYVLSELCLLDFRSLKTAQIL